MSNLKIYLLFLSLSFSFIYSQDNLTVKNKFVKKHFVTIGQTNQLNSRIRFFGVGVFMKSKFTYSPELNLGYKLDINKKWYLVSRLNFGISPFNTNYSHVTSENSIFRQGETPWDELKSSFTNYDGSYYLNLDFSMHRKFKLKNKNYISLGFGAKVYYYLLKYGIENESSYFVSNSNPIVVFYNANFDNYNRSNFNFALYSDIGYLINLKNDNQIKISLLYSYGFFKRIDGNWNFDNINGLNSGTMFQKPSFFGIALEYQLALNKWIKKLN